jgi:hypothetical protein
MGMATVATHKTFYELRALEVGRSVHCLIELEHPAVLDPWLCWLQASIQARKTLERMPTPEELRQVTAKVAEGLRKILA